MRPKMICHMVSSIDGRLIADRWTPMADGTGREMVLERYDETAARLGGQGWLVGRKTMQSIALNRHERQPAKRELEHAPSAVHIADPSASSLAITVDPSGKLHYGVGKIGDDHLVTILSKGVTEAYLAELIDDGVSYITVDDDEQGLRFAIETIGSSFAVDTILLEGGGVTNGAFLKADLIDEISLLIYPGIDGLSGISSIFEYLGSPADQQPALGKSLRLDSVETLEGGFVWVKYTVERVGKK